MPCKPGDRIRLLHMPNDPDPIPDGTTGTVRSVSVIPGMENQVNVDWDIPRSLGLIEGVDQYEVIP